MTQGLGFRFLKNGIGKRLSRCAHPPRTARTASFGAVSVSRGEKTGLQLSTQRQPSVYYNPPGTQNGNTGHINLDVMLVESEWKSGKFVFRVRSEEVELCS